MIDDKSLQERIEQLFDQLVEYIDLQEDVLLMATSEICDIYSNEDFRHSYSEISLVLEKFRPDQRDALSAHIRLIQNRAVEYVERTYSDEKQKADIKKKILKLCDHVDLECLRISRIERVEYIGKTASNELSAADGKLKETEEKAYELSERISDYHAQSIEILGIFSGLVITFSGVIQFSSLSLTNLFEVSALKIILFISCAFFFLFNIVFLLMYCISKIAGKSISSNCRKRYCEDCNYCKSTIGRLRKK